MFSARPAFHSLASHLAQSDLRKNSREKRWKSPRKSPQVPADRPAANVKPCCGDLDPVRVASLQTPVRCTSEARCQAAAHRAEPRIARPSPLEVSGRDRARRGRSDARRAEQARPQWHHAPPRAPVLRVSRREPTRVFPPTGRLPALSPAFPPGQPAQPRQSRCESDSTMLHNFPTEATSDQVAPPPQIHATASSRQPQVAAYLPEPTPEDRRAQIQCVPRGIRADFPFSLTASAALYRLPFGCCFPSRTKPC